MTQHQTPVFSIVIPLFNKAAHIDATLASVLSQTFDAFEVIVIDDGSSDGGLAIVERQDDPRLRVVRQANGGPGLARNRGIAEARGDWVAFIDADDLWLPDHLQTLLETIAVCPVADLVGTGFARGVAAGAIEHEGWGRSRFIDFFVEHGLIWTSAVAVRTAVVRQKGFGVIWPGEDVELWTRIALHHRFAINPRRTAVYVQHTGGAMDTQTSGGTFTAIERQPLFNTIDMALQDARFADRHAAIRRFRNALMLEYIRPSLFNGHTELARDYLRELRVGGERAPVLYRMLARLPGPLARAGSRAYGTIKRRLRR